MPASPWKTHMKIWCRHFWSQNNSVSDISSNQSEFTQKFHITETHSRELTLTGKHLPNLYRYDWTSFNKGSSPIIKVSLRDSKGPETSKMDIYLLLNNLSFWILLPWYCLEDLKTAVLVHIHSLILSVNGGEIKFCNINL